MKVFVYFQTNYPKETEIVRKAFTDDEWNKIKDFVSQAGNKNVVKVFMTSCSCKRFPRVLLCCL